MQPFTPVPIKARHDGWTPARQRHFIEQLAAAKSVTRACKAVGMSAVTAYALRRKPGAESFAAAWDAALAFVANPRRGRSPRTAQRLAQLAARRKANKMEEVHRPPNSPTPPPRASSALKALEALLGQLRTTEHA